MNLLFKNYVYLTMCYNAVSATRKLIAYAKHRQESPDKIAALEKKLEELSKQIRPHHHISAFAFPNLLCFDNNAPRAMKWGLIPSWSKDANIAKSTLNARIETILEKPSFKNAVAQRRCLIFLDAFYEYHHLNKKTFPFHISKKDGSPLVLAGIYEDWQPAPGEEVITTCSIITTKASGKMAIIHNNPKLLEPRIPVILNKEQQEEWLAPAIDLKAFLKKFVMPFPEAALNFKSVGKLTGKGGLGDVPEAEHEVNYDELEAIF